MEQSTLCPNCKNTYSEENPPKCLVKCHHHLCLKCLKELIICPIDKVRIQFRRFPIQTFKTNQQLLKQCTSCTSPQKSSTEFKKSNKKSPAQVTPQSRQVKSKSSKKPEPEPQKEQQVLVAGFEEENVQEEENFVPQESNITESSYKSPLLDKKQSFSPKKQAINYQMCLLHSKKADLICVEDKCVICSGCGLFGEHKHHTIIPYDAFLAQYSTLAEQCFKNYEQLQGKSDKMNLDLLEQKIGELLVEKRTAQFKNIKSFMKQLNDLLKTVQKDLITTLDAGISYKKAKIMQFLTFQELNVKRDHYMLQVESMTEGLECLFNLENVQKYISFIDPNHEKSYIQEEGEYLIRQIDNYIKTIQQRINQQVSQFALTFKTPELAIFNTLSSISSQDTKNILELVEKTKKESLEKLQNSNKSRTVSTKFCKDTTVFLGKSAQKQKSPTKLQHQDNLLLELNSKSVSPEKKDKNPSPIHPLSTFQNFSITCHSSMAPEFFLKVSADPLLTENSLQNNRRKSKTNTSKPLLPPRMSKTKLHDNIQNNNSHGQTSRLRSKPKSNNNSNNMTERELLNVLNERSDNKKRRKIQLPEKYCKVYEELQKERLEVVDFGGAFLGDSTMLAISECFQQPRGKIKQIKLMNNKLSDESFLEIVSRCRSIPSLNLSYNGFTQRCLQWLLTQAEHLGDLRNITLSNCKIVLRSNRDKIEELKRRGVNVSL